MTPNNDPESSKVFYYIVIACVVLAVVWLNYNSLKEHVSSNSIAISEFTAPDPNADKIRSPAVAGLFYSSDKQQLNDEVDHYLSSSLSKSTIRPRLLVVPHAGYMYSAQTAAQAYSLLEKYSNQISKVILVGPSHHVAFEGMAIPTSTFFITPLGKIKINQELATEISKNKNFQFYDTPHKDEHSIEVQLPFLQKILKNFSIVPIAYGQADPEDIANALKPYVERSDTIIIFSADLSHYYDYDTAKTIDEETADLVNKRASIDDHMSCGSTGINAALILAKDLNLKPELLDMTNSGDITGDKSRVVGYASWMFTEKEKAPEINLPPLEQEAASLKAFASIYSNELLKIARISVEEAIMKDSKFSPSRDDYSNDLFNKGASFVTLEKNAELKGCIGTVVPHQAIANDIAQNAYMAALEDKRFNPLTKKDLLGLDISISLLTGFEQIQYKDEKDLLEKIQKDTDGLILRDGNRQGLFLPSVWKQLSQKQEFLNNLKLKAGLSPSYWSNNIKVYRFYTVEIKENEN